jgi:hypothetical protein
LAKRKIHGNAALPNFQTGSKTNRVPDRSVKQVVGTAVFPTLGRKAKALPNFFHRQLTPVP